MCRAMPTTAPRRPMVLAIRLPDASGFARTFDTDFSDHPNRNRNMLLVPEFVLAQGRVTVYGTVSDPSGAAMAGVAVTATNSATGQSRETTSSADGGFVLPDLVIGDYRLTAQAPGFKTFTENAIELRSS